MTLTTGDEDRRATIARLTLLGRQMRAAFVGCPHGALRPLARVIPADQRQHVARDLARAASATAEAFARFT